MKYVSISRIGQGAYGTCFKARAVEDGEIVAIKQILLKSDIKSQLEVYREISCLRNVEHENVVRLRETVFTPDNVSLVFDYIETNLKIVIRDINRPQNDNITRHFFRQLLNGIAHLHNLKIMHRDLKPENILITSDMHVKIADFGLACLYLESDKNRTYSHQVATRFYRAPELLLGSTNYNLKVDLWAFGCILVEFLNGSPLFEGANDIGQIIRVFDIIGTPTDDSWPGWKKKLPDSGKMDFGEKAPIEDWHRIVSCQNLNLLNLIKGTLQLNPDARPTAPECLQNEFFLTPVRMPIDYRPPLPNAAEQEKHLPQFKNDIELDQLMELLDT